MISTKLCTVVGLCITVAQLPADVKQKSLVTVRTDKLIFDESTQTIWSVSLLASIFFPIGQVGAL